MEEEIFLILEETEEKMQTSIVNLSNQLTKIRVGPVTAALLDQIKIDYYNALTPLNQLSSISNLDGRTLNIRPWEKNFLSAIEKVLIGSDLGANAQNNGEAIILTFPQITGERRQELAQQAKRKGEAIKIRIRNARQEANEQLKKLKKEGASEDLIKENEAEVQGLTDKFIGRINSIIAKKEADILKV